MRIIDRRIIEKRALQCAIAVACVVPIGAGVAGVILGPRMMEAGASAAGDLDSHFRYLSGLLLAIGLGYVSTVPHVERHRRRFLLLSGLVILGGAARLLGVFLTGTPPLSATAFALVMELIITPGLTLWQRRIARETKPADNPVK